MGIRSLAAQLVHFAETFAQHVFSHVPEGDVNAFLTDLKSLAWQFAADSVVKMETGNFNVFAAAEELQRLAAPIEKAWAQKLAGLSIEEITRAYNANEIAKYLTLAQTITAFTAKFGPTVAVPATRVISFLIEGALVQLQAQATAATLPPKVGA